MDIGIIDSYLQLNIFLIGINIILAVGLNLITGVHWSISLGHAAFMSIGAYTSAVFTAKLGQPFYSSNIGIRSYSRFCRYSYWNTNTKIKREIILL